jgi:transcriptional regulator with XRE-family HTH domain
MNELAIFMKKKRTEEAKTQVSYANEIGITNITLSKIENGEMIGSNTIRKLSKFYKIDTRDIRNLMEMEVENENNE